jgi:hypothetical protein
MNRRRPLWQGSPRWPWVRRAVRREQERQAVAMQAYWRDQARPWSAVPDTEDYQAGDHAG